MIIVFYLYTKKINIVKELTEVNTIIVFKNSGGL